MINNDTQVIFDFENEFNYLDPAIELYEGDVPWKQEIGRFLLSWLDSSDYIKSNTSGSTGTPKEISIPKSAMLHSAGLTGDYFGFKPGQTVLLAISPAFIAGKMMLIRALRFKMKVICVEPIGNPLTHLDQDIDFAPFVPLQVYEMLKESNEEAQRVTQGETQGVTQGAKIETQGIASLQPSLQRVRTILIGGSALSTDLISKLQDLSSDVYESYGMTETVSHIALRKVNGPDKTELFQPLSGVELSLDQRGCLLIDAPGISSERIITNDLVELSDMGFKILGRIDNVVNSGGIKFIPEVLEAKISDLISAPYFISGTPDEKYGEKLVLVIEGKQELVDLDQISSRFDAMEMPKEIRFEERLARTENGKLIRRI